jgi:hypothetical protein
LIAQRRPEAQSGKMVRHGALLLTETPSLVSNRHYTVNLKLRITAASPGRPE